MYGVPFRRRFKRLRQRTDSNGGKGAQQDVPDPRRPKLPAGIDWEVHRLCINGDGVYIRPPSEILNNWTYLDVYEAHEVLNWQLECRAYDKKKLEKARQQPKPGPKALK